MLSLLLRTDINELGKFAVTVEQKSIKELKFNYCFSSYISISSLSIDSGRKAEFKHTFILVFNKSEMLCELFTFRRTLRDFQTAI